MVELIRRDGNGEARESLDARAFWSRTDPEPRIDQLTADLIFPRAPWAGLPLDEPLVMGIVNVTPDSFSDGGLAATESAAIAHGRALLEAGANIVDIGGESTRPGADPVDPSIEITRVVPVIRALAEAGAVVSVDTRHPAVMGAAIEAGARIVNDVQALRAPGAIELVARARVAVVLMHMAGEPRTMQRAPSYESVALDVFDFLEERRNACVQAGIPLGRIALDPGIGFGKTVEHNLDLLQALALFRTLGAALMVGLSRKGFIGEISGVEKPSARVAGSVAGAISAVNAGADIVRVHDVAETAQALRVWAAVRDWG